ncbi:sigma 54-interacting transcriptional regulator [Desulfoscipio sp. XC116]|uniref:sigma-54 interaction domain-containing protein n=1 Tax=Desulfoscipio sp. XC116 TaxID=3144975 RepID=UPI00325BA03B
MAKEDNRQKLPPQNTHYATSMTLAGSYDGIVLCDENGVLMQLNQSYCRITEVTAQDVKGAMGRPMEDLVQEGLVNPSVTVEVLKQRKTITLVQRIKTGKRVLVTGNPLFDELGRIKAVVTNVRDPDLFKHGINPNVHHDFWRDIRNRAPRVVAASSEMLHVLELAQRIGPSKLTVLLLGESGTGKDLVARFIHEHSDRSDGPFVPVNCAAINEPLFEAELFGYQGGAFTGANRHGKKGLVEIAHGGTLFLDEISEMPGSAQAKLLRFLQNMEYYRVGGTNLQRVDVRVICATNRDLTGAVADSLFREDLYYRIAGIKLTIPPLRTRKTDIVPLARHFLNHSALCAGLAKELNNDAVKVLESYPWPGNVRELQNTVERLNVMVKQQIITAEDILNWADTQGPPPGMTYKEVQAQMDREVLEKALEEHGGIRAAARALGVAPSTILRKKRKYGI